MRHSSSNPISYIALSLTLCLQSGLANAGLSAELELRAAVSDTQQSWVNGGLGKNLFDESARTIQLGRAAFRVETYLPGDVNAVVVADAHTERRQLLDLQEAWLSWNPVPAGSWRTRLKVGAFFPASNLELAYPGVGWTAQNSISSSAANTWIGEELRMFGAELSWLRRGAFARSPHDFGMAFTVFGGNDPAGSLLAWRGWSVGDRITGISESLKLADLPAYRSTGPIPLQRRDINLFREIDHRAGYAISASYSYARRVELQGLHYDNRGDPLAIEHGQYSWRTRFDQFGARWHGAGQWEILGQILDGQTVMGPNAVNVTFTAAYLMASRPLGAGRVAVRHDRFRTDEHDVLPEDPNEEQGYAWTVSYRLPLAKHWQLTMEALAITSSRPARALLDESVRQTERSVLAGLRWNFP